MLLKLEDLVADSDGQMDAVWKFVGVRPPKRRRVKVRKEVNRKYEEAYCADLNERRNGKRHMQIHVLLRQQFGEAVRKHGYDLDEWPCIAEAERRQGEG